MLILSTTLSTAGINSCRCSHQNFVPHVYHNYYYIIHPQQHKRKQLSYYPFLLIVVLFFMILLAATTNLYRSNNKSIHYSSQAFMVVLSPKIRRSIVVSRTRKEVSTVVSYNNQRLQFRFLQQQLHQTTEGSSTTDITTTTTTTIPPSDTSTTTTTKNIPPYIPPLSKIAKRIYWIRHGEVINPGASQNKSVFYGSMDVSLSNFGQQEAYAAGQFLSTTVPPISKIYSSNLTRAIYGAEQVRILQPPQENDTVPLLEVIQVPDFMEMNRGAWCGKTIQEIGLEQMEQFNNGNESVTPINGGESYCTLNERVIQARDDIVLASLQLQQCAVVVSHLQVTRCIVANAIQKPIYDISKISIATASITCIDYEYSTNANTNINIIDVNDVDDDISRCCATYPQKQIIHFQSYKPDIGLRKSIDGAN